MPTTIDTYAPFDTGAGAAVTEATWRKMMRHMIPTGVITGITNQFECFADSTGMQVKVKTGECFIRGHWGENLSQRTLSIAAAHATNPRIDRCILRCDFTNNRIELDILTGTAAASPTVPAVTQSSTIWEVSLAQVRVDAAVVTIAAAKITDERYFTGGDQGYAPHFWNNNGSAVTSGSVLVQATTFTQQISSGIATMSTGVLKLNRPGLWALSFKTYSLSAQDGVAVTSMQSSATGPFKPDLALQQYDWRPVSAYPNQLFHQVQFTGYVDAAAAAQDITFWVRWHASAGATSTWDYSVRAEYLGAR